MSVGSVGGVGAGMGAGAAGVGGAGAGAAASPAGAGAASASGTGPAGNAGASPGVQNLANTMKDFSSAEILIALMLAKSMSGGGDDDKSCGAAGFLAGLAMAGGLGQALGQNMPQDAGVSGVPEAGGAAATGGAGLSLNVSV